jgi:hypothetical protein
MKPLFEQILDSKQRERRRLATLPFAEKVKILEQLRERQILIAANPLRKKAKS